MEGSNSDIIEVVQKSTIPKPKHDVSERADKQLNVSLGLNDDVTRRDDKSEFFEAVKLIYDGENLEFITELSDYEIFRLTKLIMIWRWADKKVPVIKNFIQQFMELRVSKARKGRSEFFDAYKQQNQMEMMGQQEQTWGQKWFPGR